MRRRIASRIGSLLLVLIMVLSLVPASIFAAGSEPTVIIAFSDFQANSDAAGITNINTLMQRIKVDYPSADGMIFCGDLSLQYPSTTQAANIVSSITNAVNTQFNSNVETFYVQGNHDAQNGYQYMNSGGYDAQGGEYGVFVINNNDFRESYNASVLNDLKSYLNAKAAAGFGGPIFVATHRPLHFTTRGDVPYAKLFAEALNEGAEKGLNIVFLFGHNHSSAYDSYLGGGSVYLAPGSTLTVSEVGQANTSTTVPINFTYMNAGYVGATINGNAAGTDTAKTMSVFVIEDGELTVKRYDENGLHNLKAAGMVHSDYNFNGCVADTTVIPSPQVLQLAYLNEVEDTATGVKVKTENGTELTVTPETADAELLAQAGCSGDYKLYDIDVTGYTNGEKVVVMIPLDNISEPCRAFAVRNGSLERLPVTVKDGYAVITADSLGELMLLSEYNAPIDELNWVELPANGTYSYKRVENQGSFNAQQPVLLVRGPYDYILEVNNSALVSSGISISNNTITQTSAKNAWVLEPTGTANTYYFKNQTQDKYLKIENDENGTPVLADGPASGSAYQWRINWGNAATNNNLVSVAGNRYFYIRQTAIETATNTTTTAAIRLFSFDPQTSTVSESNFAALEGTEVSIFADDFATSAEAIAYVKGNIDVYTANLADYSDATATSNYTLSGTVNPAVPGDYPLTVQYGGKTLGTVTVHVMQKAIQSISLVDTQGTVAQYAAMSTPTGGTLHVVYENGMEKDVDITVGMLSGDGFNVNTAVTYEGLTVTYGDKTVSGYDLTVTPVATEWTEIPSSTTYTYTLDNDGLNLNEPYLIVADEADFAMNGIGREAITKTGNTIVTETRGWEWNFETVERDENTQIRSNVSRNNSEVYPEYINNGYYYNSQLITGLSCRRNNGNTYTWTVTTANGTFTVSNRNITLQHRVFAGYSVGYNGQYLANATANKATLVLKNTADAWSIEHQGNGLYYIVANGLHLRHSNSDERFMPLNEFADGVYLYKYTETTTTQAHYLGMEGDRSYGFTTGRFANTAALEAYLREQITVYSAADANGTDKTAIDNYTLVGTADPKQSGTYTLKVMHEGVELGALSVTFAHKAVESIELSPMEGMIYRGASLAPTGSMLTVHYVDGSSEQIPMTASMLSGSNLNIRQNGTYANLTVTYGGKTVEGYTLDVISRPGEVDYPEYPDGGSVRVDKWGNGIDFNASGIARVQLAASGIPTEKGVDVILMMDTSGSMVDYGRVPALKAAVSKMLEIFQRPNEDGSAANIRLAVADFNGYTWNGQPAIDANDRISGFDDSPANTDIYTGSHNMDASAFVDVNSIDNTNNAFVDTFTNSRGTNYDHGLDTVYRLGTAIHAQNIAEGEDRDLFVIFMSDGATHQYNYYYSDGNHASWNNWVLGTVTGNTQFTTEYNNSQHKYFYNPDGDQWMAEAIKGSSKESYPVIDPTRSLGEDATATYGDYFRMVPGLDATMYTIGFDLAAEGSMTAEMTAGVIENLASVNSTNQQPRFYNAANGTALQTAFDDIASEIRVAARKARFIDTLGVNYDLQMAKKDYRILAADGETVIEEKTYTPTIRVASYPVYSREQLATTVNGHIVTNTDIGNRYGTATVLETVTFNDAGTQAYSDKKAGNILINGVICADTFWYNTTNAPVQIDINNDGNLNYMLDSETFYWDIDVISDTEFTFSYDVYLTGSMEGTRDAGVYPTNESAILYYINWLGNEVHQSTVSPVLPWQQAMVSCGFYLVNDNGEVITNRTTGATGSFANRVRVSESTLYATFPLNSSQTVVAAEAAAAALPEGYALYDVNAAYEIHPTSYVADSYWNMTGGNGTTYVVGYDLNGFTNQMYEGVDVEYTHTTVWFAVKHELKCVPDTVVVDYGLPVDIHVLENDMFGTNGILAGIGLNAPENNISETLAEGFTNELNGTFGRATVQGDRVRYALRSMIMTAPEHFTYAVNYQNAERPQNNGHYYGAVTVIPATTIYYEDSFVAFTGDWVTEGTTDSAARQDEDRPGTINISQIDANSVYGYDSAYTNYTTYSLGSAQKTTVSAGMTAWPTASFTFTGTAFDIISVTSGETGTVMVEVNQNGANVARWAVDTYYGYDSSGNLTVADNGALYQIPVLKSPELAYGTYEVVIKPMYSAFFQHKEGTNSYDFYLDSIRIYNPAQGNEEAEAAYLKDKEGYPQYIELRNQLIGQNGFGASSEVTGAVFIDNYGVGGSIDNYTNFGPNNEIYLAQGQSIAFNIRATDASKIAAVRLGAKCVNGDVALTLNGKERVFTTASDLYYDITPLIVWGQNNESKTIIITNTGENIASLTNIKITYQQDPAQSPVAKMFMTREGAKLAIQSIYNLHMEDDRFDSEETALKLVSAALVLNGKIDIVFTAEIPEGYENAGMVFSGAYGETTVTEYQVVDGKYRFTYAGITPQQIGDNISATLYATRNGKEESVCVPNYSVRQYCINLLGSTDCSAALRTLISDLLAYGAAAQHYTGYQTDTPVNEGSDIVAPTYSSFSELTGREVTFTGTADDNIYWQAAGLTLKNSVAMNFRFYTSSTENLTVEIVLNGTTHSFDASRFVSVDGKPNTYEISFEGICANEFEDAVTASFVKDGVLVGNAVSYSVNTYIQRMQHSDNAQLQALVQALYNYGAAAAAYAQ